MKIINKNLHTLYKVENCPGHLYNSIKNNIPTSIFSVLDYKFFNSIVKKKVISLFQVKFKKKNSVIITVVPVRNFTKLKYEIILYFLTNPIIFLFNISKIFNSLTRASNTNFDKNYLHLLHFIIYKKNFMNISLKKKDQTINFIFKHILKIFKSKSLFLCYEKNNFRASKFYLRNNFKIYKVNKSLVFVKKKIL